MAQTRSVRSYVRLGSLADIAQRPRHVRYSPQSGHSSARFARPLSANGRHVWIGGGMSSLSNRRSYSLALLKDGEQNHRQTSGTPAAK